MKSLQKQNRPFEGLNGNQIKLLACAAMFCDHAVKAWGIYGPARVILSQVFGRIAFPIYCFFLAEGFFHTTNRKKYLLRMVIFAALAEVPFDLVIFRTAWYPQYQNTLWALSLGLVMFFCLSGIGSRREMSFRLSAFLQGLVIAGFAAAAHFVHVDYHARGLLAMAFAYYLCKRRPASLAAFWESVCLNLNRFANPGAFFSLIPLYFYNGKRGDKKLKYFYYIFYPAHLLFLYVVACYIR